MNSVGKMFVPVLTLVVIIWTVEVVNLLLGHRLTSFGVLPRSSSGLIGIVLSPFIHAGFWHAVSNTIPLLILGGLTLAADKARFLMTTVAIILLSGTLVWLFARNSYHVGASGLVFGYFGALITRAIIEHSIKSIILAMITITLYGGLLWGILPLRSYISFEGHFFGLLAGIAYIWIIHRFAKGETVRD
jgi:membrane associated rhomboid family serine protease